MDSPNIVFVVLDAVRAQNLSLYGHTRETTPFLESLTDESVLYEHAYSPANWTPASHGSMFTGTYPWVHGTGFSSNVLHPNLPTLAECLSEVGYRTLAFSNNVRVSPTFGFDRGFDKFAFNQRAYGEPLRVKLQFKRYATM